MGVLDGRVALVTGAASGLGAHAARQFARAGAAVCCADVNDEGVAETVAAIHAAGGQALAAHLDVTREDQQQATVDATLDHFARLDILMTCAGIGESERIEALDLATFERTMAINVTGTFLSIKSAWEALGRDGGSVIALGSVAGLIGGVGFSAYGASKAAVINLIRNLAMEGAPKKIRCNTICPSWIWTPMVDKTFQRLLPGAPPETVRTYLARQAPLGRIGTPDDVANAAIFLASDASSFMTGREIVLDGGMTIGPSPR